MSVTSRLPDIITKARARLLVRAPFFGALALGLKWIDAPEIGTMATDGRAVWFCTAWCEAQGAEKTMGVVAHEVLHVVNKHHLRRRGRDLHLWNVACDLFINRILMADGFVLPDTLIFDTGDRFAGLPVEIIYERLLTEQASQSGSGTPPPEAGGSPAQGGTPAAGPGEPGSGPAEDAEEHTGRAGAVTPAAHWGEVRDLTAGNGAPPGDAARRQAEDDLDVRIRQAAAAATRAGRYAGALSEMVDAALYRIDWRNRFRTLFDGTLRSDSSWARPNRRFLPRGLYLPGWRRAGAGRVAFVLDTSGSISSAELATCVGNLLGLIEETGPEQIAVIQCDTAVRKVDYLGPGETVDRIEVHGRGGTLFQPAFTWIAGSGFDPHIIVYATDLASRDTPTDPGVAVIWLTPSRGRTIPFGDIVEVTP